MENRAKPITINDIASILNISPSTVSRALQNHPDIKKSTIEKVQETAKKLNYEPNINASNLRKSRSNTIGIIVPKIANYFYSSAIEGIEETAFELGYKIVISQSLESFEREITNSKNMLYSRVEGILAAISKETDDCLHFQHFLDRNIPIVFFNRIPKNIAASKVYSDDYKGARLAAAHLIATGCRILCHLKGPENLFLTQNRYSGFLDEAEKHQIQVNQSLIAYNNYEISDGYNAMKKILQKDLIPDGVLAFNDRVAIGAMKAIKEKGLKMPDDISIIGFSNTPESQIVEPSLSTIDQSGAEVGKRAFNILLGQIIDKTIRVETDVVDTKIIIRESTKN